MPSPFSSHINTTPSNCGRAVVSGNARNPKIRRYWFWAGSGKTTHVSDQAVGSITQLWLMELRGISTQSILCRSSRHWKLASREEKRAGRVNLTAAAGKCRLGDNVATRKKNPLMCGRAGKRGGAAITIRRPTVRETGERRSDRTG